MGAPVRCGLLLIMPRVWQAIFRNFSNVSAHDFIHADMISIGIWMIYICNVLILMQNQLKIA